MYLLCKVCGDRLVKKKNGRVPQYCDTCRKKLQDQYKKGK